MKKVRKIFSNDTYQLNNNQLRILFTIGMKKTHEILTQKDYAEKVDKPLTTINYHFKKLRTNNLITNKNELTLKGIKAIQYFKQWDKTLNKKLRAHKIQISVNILKLPSNFFNVKHKILTPFSNKRYQGLKGQLQGSQILFYSSTKLIVKIPDVFGNTNDEIMGCINDCIQQLFTVLTKEFPGIIFNDYEICKFNSMHVAVLNSIIAESFLLKKGRCMTSGDLCIDGSHGGSELECEKLKNIAENVEVLVKYEDLAKENRRLQKLLLKKN